MKPRHKLSWVVISTATLVAAWVWFVPFPGELLSYDNLTSTRLVDRHGRPLREALGATEGRARRVGLDAVSPHMVAATVHAEDRRFWSHAGVDPLAIGRAAWQNMTSLEVVSGASTLTQQVAKMVAGGSRARTLPNKLEETVLAIRLDKASPKRTILEHYLNRAPYGNQLFGVAAASSMYFDKPPSQLTLAESALLAGIPRAPSLNNPYADFGRAKRVQRRVLALMQERGVVDEAEYKRALEEELTIVDRRGRVAAAHFTDHVLAEDRVTESDRPQRIETTLDLDLQHKIRGIVRQELARLERKKVGQAAVVVLDTDTNEVLAWVGSRDYFDEERGGANDGVIARRQPGSALKPFVYGLYLDHGGSAADMLPDFPAQFPAKDGVYIPENYDRSYHGPVSVRDALASSLNIPAVHIAHQLGAKDVHQKLLDFGFDTLDAGADHYGLGIALGNGEVRLLDLAAAYSTLGRLGIPKPVRLTHGEPRSTSDTQERIFSTQTSYLLLDILSDDRARARGFGRYSALHLPYKVAAKTGTSAGFRDNWAVGVTPDYTVAVWAGNFDATPMVGSSGVTGAAPILRQAFQALYPLAARPADVDWYERPDDLEAHTVCALSGQKSGPLCPRTRTELFGPQSPGLRSSRPPVSLRDPERVHSTCTIHRTYPIDTRNNLLASSNCPTEFIEKREFLAVPDAWAEWAVERGHRLPPTGHSPLCGDNSGVVAQPAHLQITHPMPGDTFIIDPSLPRSEQQVALRVEVPTSRRDESLTWFVDGSTLTRTVAPFRTFWTLEPGTHTIGVGRERVEASVTVAVE